MPEAVIGFTGVIIGALLAPIIEWIRVSRADQKKAQYLAIRVTCILDKFVDMCVAVAQDEGTADEQGIYEYHAPQPRLADFPDDLDWKTIDHKLAYDILNLPNKIDDASKYINAALEHWIFPPYDELGWELQYEFSTLGLLAVDIGNRLRDTYKIPHDPVNARNPDWHPHKFLRDTKNKIELTKKRHEEGNAELNASLNITSTMARIAS